jgi:ribosomal protein L7/L12
VNPISGSSKPLEDPEIQQLVADCSQRVSRGDEVECLLAYLRERTHSKIKSILVLSQVLDLSLSEAKERVDLSQTWSDVYERDMAFHDIVEEAARQLAKESEGTG